MYIIPAPEKMIIKEGQFFYLKFNAKIIIDPECDLQVSDHAKLLRTDIMEKLAFDLMLSKGKRETGCIYVSLDGSRQREEYILEITKDGITIIGGSNAGIFYGIQTLRQIIGNQGSVLSCLMIEDLPAMPRRGYWHDVTRGRIPTMESLKELADKLAFYKINQLQLYVEHSFMFRDFSEVWRDDTPLTAQDILEYDRYCKELHIDLVPAIASFGHLYKVLKTASFAGLCELEGTDREHFSLYRRMNHHTLDVSQEASFDFVTGMIDEYMPLFSSDYFNICADETFDLGKGRSKALADEIGMNDMYIGFVKRVCEYVAAKGKIPMFWGDIICGFPEYITKLPKETICLNWGYAADHGEKGAKDLFQAGAAQYLCPGVSAWNHWVSLIRVSYENIKRMCGYGYKYQAAGILNTDWGDYGHINHPEFSTTGLIYGAAFSWNRTIPEYEEINRQISRLEYGDNSGKFVETIAEISQETVVTWYEIACHKEMKQDRIGKIPWGTIFENLTWEKIDTANERLTAIVTELYRLHAHAGQEKRNRYGAYILAAEGVKLWNLAGGTAALGEREAYPGRILAGELEYWYQEYKKLWRSVSREAELYRIGEVVFWYADLMRGKRNTS